MKYLILALQGMAVGGANIIPGISGATLAVIFRVYDQLIEAANRLFSPEFKKSFRVLIPFVLGALVGILALGSAIGFFIERALFQTTMFIAGLMAGTIPFLHRQAISGGNKKAAHYWVAVAAGAAIILMVVFTPASPAYADAAHMPIIFFFVGGLVAAAVMVIPGVSGSMVLIMLGLYPAVIYIINLARGFLLAPSASLLVPILRVALPMIAGVLLGGVLMSKLMAVLLKKHFNLMYFLILGLVIGTIVILFIDPDTRHSFGELTPFTILASIPVCAVGAFLAFRLGKQADPDTVPASAPLPAE